MIDTMELLTVVKQANGDSVLTVRHTPCRLLRWFGYVPYITHYVGSGTVWFNLNDNEVCDSGMDLVLYSWWKGHQYQELKEKVR